MPEVKKTMTISLTDDERARLEALLPRAVSPMEGWVVTNAAQDRFRRWLNGAPTWTKDVMEATYYARRQDAENVHEDDDDAWGVILVPLPALSTPSLAQPAAGDTVGWHYDDGDPDGAPPAGFAYRVGEGDPWASLPKFMQDGE